MAAKKEFEPSLSGWLTEKTYNKFMKLEQDVSRTSTALRKQGEKLYKFRNFFLKELLEIGKDKKIHKNLEEKDQEKDVISLDSSPSPTWIRSSSPSSNSSDSDQFTPTKKSRRKGRRVQTYQGHMAKRQMRKLKRNSEKERGTTKEKEPMNDIQLPSVFSDDENSITEVSEPCDNETKTPCVQDSAAVDLKKFSLILEKIRLPTNACSPGTSGTGRAKEHIETLTEEGPSSPQTSEASIEIPFQGRGNESLDSPKPIRRNPKRRRFFDGDDKFNNDNDDKILETPEKKTKAIEDKLGLKSCRDLFSSDEIKSTQSQKLSMEDNEIEKSNKTNEPTETTRLAEEDMDSDKISPSPDLSSPSSHSTYQCPSPQSTKKSSPKPTRISPRKSLRPRRIPPSENESKRITRSKSIHTSNSNCINTEGSSELDSGLLKCPSHPPPRTSTKKKNQKEKELPKSVDEEEHSNLSTEVSAVSRSMRYFNTEDTTQSTDPPTVKARLNLRRVTRASMLPSRRQSESMSSHSSILGESKLGISSILRRRKTLLTAKLGTTSFLTDTFAEEEKSRSSGHTSIRINARSFVAPKLKMSKKEGTL